MSFNMWEELLKLIINDELLNAKDLIRKINIKENTSKIGHFLHIIAEIDNANIANIMETILRIEPDLINVVSTSGRSLIHSAAFYGQKRVVDLLIFKNSDLIYKRDHEGRTAIHFAAMSVRNSYEIIKYIISVKQESINDRDDKGYTAIQYAASSIYSTQETIKLLISLNPMSLNDKDYLGRNILHLALLSKNEEVIKLLLNYKFEPMYELDNDTTAINLAVVAGNKDQTLITVSNSMEHHVIANEETGFSNSMEHHVIANEETGFSNSMEHHIIANEETGFSNSMEHHVMANEETGFSNSMEHHKIFIEDQNFEYLKEKFLSYQVPLHNLFEYDN